MITHEDQLGLFTLVAKELSADVTCYAFGGTAMMFYGYKDETKDVDILFETIAARQAFIDALARYGYAETSPIHIYELRKAREKTAPLMYKRGDVRFDLFAEKIFQTLLSPKMREDLFAVHEFKGAHTLTVKVLHKEFIVMLKAVTERDRDFEDILTIIRKEKQFNWQYLLDEVQWQYQHGDGWIVFDMEKTLKQLRSYTFVEEKYLKQLYAIGAERKGKRKQ